mmetsp:Transcript_26743/g.42373  ORF Transcript_26743/g.42373 Transcript_26743/m.42373 type:complete len:292 (+) Transcript_26743:80-955(+)|eukprot:CAMPEP_0197023420 /NCGR_PEP_ID=MMETSP1384-20130603/4110_1 /TAXON_ID=29189 /ORGANISM="Ammonia sp." /LENGTH=291 /DNA_ID=CAMNT_0042451623 /DNA_START=65 /DNA_END=940 /DNA_ORIENTATION=-
MAEPAKKETTEPKSTPDSQQQTADEQKGNMDKVKEKLTEWQKAGDKFLKGVKKDAQTRLTMEGQLAVANESLSDFLSPKIDIEKQIPVQLMKNAKGIIFLTSLKISLGFGAAVGSGIVLAKLENGDWSGPCSVGLIGGQGGLNIGAQQTDFVIVLRDEKALKAFNSKGQLQLGLDASVSAGPLGRNAQVAVSGNDKGYSATVSYSRSKGLYIGWALNGQGIVVRNDCNEAFYGDKSTAEQILNKKGEKIDNKDYVAVCSLLNDYIAKSKSVESDKEKAEKEAAKDDAKDDK